jgi:hypothetical protein
MDDPRLNTSRHIVFNLSRPEKSLILLAPLAESAGGWGLCRDPKSRERKIVFDDTQDPGYQALLALNAAGRRFLQQDKRFDLPGFFPRSDWVREMKRFGIVPRDREPADVCDVYGVEQAYWKSLWYQPPTPQLSASPARVATRDRE